METDARKFINKRKEKYNYLGNIMDSAAWDEVEILLTDFAKQQTSDLRRQLSECKAKSRHGLNQSDKFGL